MAYSDFTLEKAQRAFGLRISENVNHFSGIPEVSPSNLLVETLDYNTPLALAINTEKSRSEMIISPILIEVRKKLGSQISLFSGVEFSVEPGLGLTGTCDFLFSRSSEQLFITAPVVTIVEAKKDNINSGLGQCVSEMVAASLFNEKEGSMQKVYGAITTGSIWKFLVLDNQDIDIDLSEYYLRDLCKILGVLIFFCS